MKYYLKAKLKQGKIKRRQTANRSYVWKHMNYLPLLAARYFLSIFSKLLSMRAWLPDKPGRVIATGFDKIIIINGQTNQLSHAIKISKLPLINHEKNVNTIKAQTEYFGKYPIGVIFVIGCQMKLSIIIPKYMFT